ncbi:MAG: DUF2258 domain-containing protein [Sulfolobaceae archaeon]|nr:DUF2258 domain-containing protein [Sulfolobaceae archaeon]
MSTEETQRDIERAEEYEQTTMRASALGENKFELSTGLIIAARYADKLRRVALVAFSKIAPKDVILRDVSELNKQLYEEIVNKRKIDKLDVIRITVEAYYDKENNKLTFNNVKIIRYVPEDECESRYKPVMDENQKLKDELNKLKESLNNLLKTLSS